MAHIQPKQVIPPEKKFEKNVFFSREFRAGPVQVGARSGLMRQARIFSLNIGISPRICMRKVHTTQTGRRSTVRLEPVSADLSL